MRESAPLRKGPKKEVHGPADWDLNLLKERKYFAIRLLGFNDTVLDCKFIAGNAYNILVETESGVLLVPKHSILYYVIEDKV